MSKWLVNPLPRPDADLRLICFPYAGGNAATFTPWIKQLSTNVELIAIQAPGRASRLFESPHNNMDELIAELLPLIPTLLDKPTIFYGHSLGSRVAFELMTRLKAQGLPLPVHFIASGSRGPQVKAKENTTYHLADDAFMTELENLNGTPKAVLENKELMELFLPLLRADFEIAETYQYNSKITFDCPLTVLGGEQDIQITREHLQGWQDFFALPADIQILPGDHFFIDSHPELVTEQVNNIIGQLTAKLPAKAISQYG
ncbi:thioesterase II family protein [Thalassomonas haliotis]|uniref:Thioesterase n=1 Tax=Thalassomonas haliotis TaxID=485448 RepID=A0ABY7VKT0_9GAMM|nr:alpha/beta fold hydrolase [Thalassomonas haliotis]WDE13824.1 thioesterase [Thalassomonas haliotis]